jgi:hypothetical protein
LHTKLAPLITPGIAFTVKAKVAGEPQPVEYVIVRAPAATPVTTPPAVIVARPVLLLLQVPPELVVVKVAVLPTHNGEVPVIVPDVLASVTVVVAIPQPSLL